MYFFFRRVFNFIANKRKAFLPEHEAERINVLQEKQRKRDDREENEEYRDDYYDKRDKETVF